MPARVTIEATVWSDARYDVLARLLSVDRFSAVGRMAAVWGECADQETEVLDSVFIAVHLGCDSDNVPAILEAARLGEHLEDGMVRIRGCAGRIDWLAAKRANGRRGGRPRRGKPEPAGNRDVTETEPRANPPAPAPAPAPAPVALAARETRARACGPDDALVEAAARAAAPPPQPPDRSTPPPIPPDRHSELYLAWERMGKARGGAKFGHPPGEVAGRMRIRELLHSPLLPAGVSDDEIRHGLAMLAVEAEEHAKRGHTDPWRWYRQALTSPRTMAAAIALPDEDAARARAGDDAASRKGKGAGTTSVRRMIEAATKAVKEGANV